MHRAQAVSLCAVSLGVLAFVVAGLSRASGRQVLGDLLLLLASGSWSTFGVLLRQWRAPGLVLVTAGVDLGELAQASQKADTP